MPDSHKNRSSNSKSCDELHLCDEDRQKFPLTFNHNHQTMINSQLVHLPIESRS